MLPAEAVSAACFVTSKKAAVLCMYMKNRHGNKGLIYQQP